MAFMSLLMTTEHAMDPMKALITHQCQREQKVIENLLCVIFPCLMPERRCHRSLTPLNSSG